MKKRWRGLLFAIKSLDKYAVFYIIGLIFTTINYLPNCILPLLYQLSIKISLYNYSLDILVFFTILVGLIIIYIPLASFGYYLKNVSVFKAQTDLRKKLTSHILSAEYMRCRKKATGDFLIKAMSDTEFVNELFNEYSFTALGKSVLYIVFSSISIINASLKLYLLCIIVCSPFMVIALIVIPRLRELENTARANSSHLTSQMLDIISLQDSIKLFQAESFFINRIRTSIEKTARSRYTHRIINGLWDRTVDLVEVLQSFLIVLIIYANNTIVSSTDLALLLGNIVILSRGVMSLSTFLLYVQPILVRSNRVSEVFDIPKENKEIPQMHYVTSLKPNIICVKDIDFSYGDNVLFNRASLIINEGEFVIIKGPSGEGKSTLLLLLCSLLNPETGTVSIMGYTDQSSILDLCALVPQNSFFINDTVESNIKIVSTTSTLNIRIIAQQVGIDEELLAKRVEGYGDNLSGGEKQRIGIARALYKNSPVLLLDEITSSLDDKLTQDIIALLVSFKKKKTIVLVTHDDIETCADRCILLEDKKLRSYNMDHLK